MLEKIDTAVDDDIPRPYKEFPYFNSNKEPFGLTLKGKTKQYVNAHIVIKDLVIKGKEVVTPKGRLKFLDTTTNSARVQAIVEIESDKKNTGNAELIAYDPSKKKIKGATIELRKVSGLDYSHVEDLKEILKFLLNRVLDGEDIQPLKISQYKASINRSIIYECELCNWKTKFSSALKTHNKRMHTKPVSLESNNSKKRPKSPITSNSCDLVIEQKSESNKHTENTHVTNETALGSPPRKKSHDDLTPTGQEVITLDESTNETTGLSLKEHDSKVKDLEATIKHLLESKEQDNLVKQHLEAQINSVDRPVRTDNVHSVQEKHISRLRGHRLIYKTIADGRCLQNCLAMHVYRDEHQAGNARARINKHLIENWHPYYKYKVTFPITETVGVGLNAKTIRINNDEEMISFLKTEDAQYVYSSYHDVLAMANVFNVYIHVFTFKDDYSDWFTVGPDSTIVDTSVSEFMLPDMYVYHSKDTHYDLLVLDSFTNEIVKPEKSNVSWNLITNRKSSKNVTHNKHVVNEKVEKVAKNQGSFLQSTNIYDTIQFTCKKCDNVFNTQNDLSKHMETHDTELVFTCEDCNVSFKAKSDLEIHIQSSHVNSHTDWICNDCDYQGETALQLMKHLKLTSHNPSQSIEKKKLFNDYKKCYTCNLECDGYLNLMNHRKEVHPSRKKCRNFPNGDCIYGQGCWYVHEEQLMDVDESVNGDIITTDSNNVTRTKCPYCETVFLSKNEFMKHRKLSHSVKVKPCNSFLKGNCLRSDESCWFIHDISHQDTEKKVNSSSLSDFQMTPKDHVPMDGMKMVLETLNTLCQKVQELDTQFRNLKQ